MKGGSTFRIEKLSHGFAYGNVAGSYLNSPPKWLECGIIVAPDHEAAVCRASKVCGCAAIRVREVADGETSV